VRDPIAITEYLGQGFSDNSYRTPESPPAPTPTSIQAAAPPAPEPSPTPAKKPTPKTLEFPGAAPKASPAQMILEQEKLQKLVESLKTAEQAKAATELVKKGAAAVPALLSALERRDPELRQAAVEVLQAILKHAIPFDAYAVEATRKQQLAALRDLFERKAG
jgi:hypothetical protein